ncbi:hypothetical protein GCM10027425_21300 [Alteromonas gracilis]
MSQPPLPHPAALPPRKPRPRALWWFVGGGLLLLGVISFVALLLLTLGRATTTDVTGQLGPQGEAVLTVPTDERRMLFLAANGAGAPCQLVTRSGRPLELERSGLSATVTVDGVQWYGVGTFTSPESEVLAVCDALPGTGYRVGEPLGSAFVGGILATIFVPMALGGLGLIVLLVTAVLWFTRPPRAQSAGPAGAPPFTPPGGQQPGQPPYGPPGGH